MAHQHMCVFACVLLLLRFGGMYMCSPCKTIFHSWEEEDIGSPWESHEKVEERVAATFFCRCWLM